MASLRFMRRVTVQIYPFQKCTVVPRTLYNMLSTNKALESNPACKPELQVLDTYSPASVRVEWDDNSVSEFNAEKYSVQDMINSLNQKRSLLEFAADVKSIKDEWEEEPDPFEEARIEAEKRHQERLRKGNKKK